MKRNITTTMRISLAIMLILGSIFALQSTEHSNLYADEAKVKLLSVTGKGEIKAEPDIAYINLTVKTINKDIKKAQEENAKLMNKVIQEILAQKVERKYIQTSDYFIQERYDWTKESQVFKGYELRNSITVKIKDISKAGQILDKATKAGANLVGGISFDVENREELYREALKIAMKSAQLKADAILSSFGAKATQPYSISEGLQENYGRSFNGFGEMKLKEESAADQAAIEGGTMSISAIVNVQYSY